MLKTNVVISTELLIQATAKIKLAPDSWPFGASSLFLDSRTTDSSAVESPDAREVLTGGDFLD
jgi:hypothetical protein